MAVNVSATVLHDPRFVDMVDEALATSGADATKLVLEVTEQAAMIQPEVSLGAMRALRTRGIGFSIDDFGTGQSSLTYLHLLPVQEVKIDRSFVARLVEGSPEAAIARSVVDLAHNLGMTALAEGIEDESALELLRSYGCDLGQGWHLGRPMPGSEVAGWRAAALRR
jgi:EAL domain-containing protein (putative c-di-GMP-specific phosphodiesterase class I)